MSAEQQNKNRFEQLDVDVVYDYAPDNELPVHFRTMHDQSIIGAPAGRIGLEKVRASGSGQFSAKSLLLIMKAIGEPFTIIDVRDEAHGFINGHAVSWRIHEPHHIPIYVDSQMIEKDEQQLLSYAAQAGHIDIPYKEVLSDHKIVIEKTDKMVDIHTTLTERMLCAHYDIDYTRMTVTDKHSPPSVIVDQFVAFALKSQAEKRWLHIHCLQGRGRTTTMLILYDMLMNAHQVSFDHIIYRQKMLGNVHLEAEGDAHHRFILLRNFYRFAQERAQGSNITWSTYITRS